MIKVKRTDAPAQRLGGKDYPARFSCEYTWNGKVIATYYSLEDVVRLNTKYIEPDFKKSCFERAMNGQFPEAYQELFGMLGCDETTAMSEFMFI